MEREYFHPFFTTTPHLKCIIKGYTKKIFIYFIVEFVCIF